MRQRYEKERADWLLAHEIPWTLSDRRQAQKLKRKAAQMERKASGAAESSFHEGQIAWFPARFIKHGEDPKEQFARIMTLVLIVTPAMVLLAGPAILLAKGLYAVTWFFAPFKPKKPKGEGHKVRAIKMLRVLHGLSLKRWSWLIASGVAGLAGLVAVGLDGQWLYLEPRFPIIFIDYAVLMPLYMWLQITLGLALVAWILRCTGWPAVKGSPRSGKKALPEMPEAPAERPKPTIPKADETKRRIEDEEDEDLGEGIVYGDDIDTDPEPADAAPETTDSKPRPMIPVGGEYKKEVSDG